MLTMFCIGIDSAESSTNSISANNFFHLGSLLADSSLDSFIHKTIATFSTELLQHPFLFSSMLPAVIASNLSTSSVILAGRRDDSLIMKYQEKLRGRLLTNTTIL